MLNTRQRGMTLVELVVTLSLFGLLVMAAVPSITGWIRNAEVRTAAESMLAGLQKARSEAVRRNETVTFSLVTLGSTGILDNTCALSATSASWIVSQGDPSAKCDRSASSSGTPVVLDKYTASEGGRTATVAVLDAACTNAATNKQVSFNGYGQIASSASAIRCIDISHSSDEARRLRLVIGIGGTVRLCTPGVDTNDPRNCNL